MKNKKLITTAKFDVLAETGESILPYLILPKLTVRRPRKNAKKGKHK